MKKAQLDLKAMPILEIRRHQEETELLFELLQVHIWVETHEVLILKRVV